ncbi:MAG TPA: ribonuclease catalytic domain-containing protein [Desulfosalsimonadaceae bacterium]|nr:ribonuclease catalytic domain-containing protein [Desulfosalsimonadaceae bacterium]
MESGIIVEYIEQQRVLCAVVLNGQEERVRLLNETGREVHYKTSRLSHASDTRINVNRGRDRIIEFLKETSARREAIRSHIDVRELWEVLSPMGEWVDLETMTGLCFPENSNGDHEAALIRACFENRIYFKFNYQWFFPHAVGEVEKNIAKEQEKARRQQLIEDGGAWLKQLVAGQAPTPPKDFQQIVGALKSYYLFGKESRSYSMAKAMLSRAGVENPDKIFDALVRLGVWTLNQNLELDRFEISIDFSGPVSETASHLPRTDYTDIEQSSRKDLTDLELITIDGQGTLDFDDALSIEPLASGHRIGVHIADVGAYVPADGVIDRAIINRGTSIYMPDMKIPMLPPRLAEDLCSLRAGEVRPAISIFFTVTHTGGICDSDIFPSLISVKRQISYNDADLVAESDPSIRQLHRLAVDFRNQRLADGAVLISLPEVSLRVFENGEISIKKLDRDSPSRLLVSEMMIMANWLMAKFLHHRRMPAVFRSQPEPRGRLYQNPDNATLFQNWMQRRMLSRVVLSPVPEYHSGLGLDAYVTATSPIRKYFDLVAQRQLRACFDLEKGYSADEIEQIIQQVQQPMTHAAITQTRRFRYWMLKYLEGRIGHKEEAIVLDKRWDKYTILLTAYLVECRMPVSGGWELKPGDLIQITLQRVNARQDKIAVILG